MQNKGGWQSVRYYVRTIHKKISLYPKLDSEPYFKIIIPGELYTFDTCSVSILLFSFTVALATV